MVIYNLRRDIFVHFMKPYTIIKKLIHIITHLKQCHMNIIINLEYSDFSKHNLLKFKVRIKGSIKFLGCNMINNILITLPYIIKLY